MVGALEEKVVGALEEKVVGALEEKVVGTLEEKVAGALEEKVVDFKGRKRGEGGKTKEKDIMKRRQEERKEERY